MATIEEKNAELKKAVDELEEATNPKEEKEEKETTTSLLAKSVNLLTGLLSSRKTTEEPKKEELAAKTEPAKETVQKSEAKEEDGVINVTEILEDFRTGLKKSFDVVDGKVGALEGRFAGIEATLDGLGTALISLCKSHAELHKSFSEQPASVPLRGAVYLGGRSDEKPTLQKSTSSRGAVMMRIERARNAGQIEDGVLSLYSKNPNEALRLIPEDVKKSFDIPDELTKAA